MAIDSVVEGSRELCLMKQEGRRMYVTNMQDNLISATGKKECYETLHISTQIRKGEKPQMLRVIFSSSWHVEYLLGCEGSWQVSVLQLSMLTEDVNCINLSQIVVTP